MLQPLPFPSTVRMTEKPLQIMSPQVTLTFLHPGQVCPMTSEICPSWEHLAHLALCISSQSNKNHLCGGSLGAGPTAILLRLHHQQPLDPIEGGQIHLR